MGLLLLIRPMASTANLASLRLFYGSNLIAYAHHSVIVNGQHFVLQNLQLILLRAIPRFADRIPAYLQNCRQNIVVMLDALDRVDFETVTSLGHQMRGSGGAFGFQAITDIGAELQQAAESADDDVSRKWVRELSNFLDGVDTDVRIGP